MQIPPNEATIRGNIDSITAEKGFDVIIICCSSEQQAGYWQQRLEDGRGSLLPTSCSVLAVSEDWKGGAGNALGTLYAFQKATTLASERGMDLEELVRSGKASVGMYHTAGKGTRLAPLPGAENNNKPGVKLPVSIKVGSELVPMTILEAVIRQTSPYAISRPGRLSVFWGDQVFIPTIPFEYAVKYHVDILCSLGPMPSEEAWKEKGMDKYGLIAQSTSGEAAQVEKVSFDTANNMLAGLGSISSVGVSLGSFSVSGDMLFALLAEFSEELAAKQGKFDSDPHLWMPMTLSKGSYIELMKAKDVAEDVASSHFDRIARFLEGFKSQTKACNDLGLFGPVDVGQGVYWWDYGQLKLYQRNALLLAADTSEASLMRRFFGILDGSDDTSRISNSSTPLVTVDDKSCVSNCNLGVNVTSLEDVPCGSVKSSVLCNVKCKFIDAEDCILINVTAERIFARPGCIVYNVVDTGDDGLDLGEDQVMAGVFSSDGSQRIMNSSKAIDGGKAWSVEVAGNPKSFEAVYMANMHADPLTLERVIKESHEAKWHALVRQSSQDIKEGKSNESVICSNIDSITAEKGFDVIIICCSSEQQAGYWQQRLEDGRGSLLPTSCSVLAVSEDWKGGAGNALGTLYAFQKATTLASERGMDLEELVRSGKASVGMYHTAGKGTRLAPLPGAENNNKPGVKLPVSIKVGSELVPMTILEAVIRQTSPYAISRPGRLSVFWGDQVFIPTIPFEYAVKYHVDILCSLGPMPSEEAWKEKGMDKYGLIAQSTSGEAAQVEKVSFDTANNMLAGLGSISSVGVSLGSFSVSGDMLFALLAEFSEELAAKQGKFDSDPHLWMPMTLSKGSYIELMKAKDVAEDVASSHFDRIARFLEGFKSQTKACNDLGLFGPVDVGQGVYWWDYGQLKLYQRNALLLAADTSEASLMRRFFGILDGSDDTSRISNSSTPLVTVDDKSCVSNCNLGVNVTSLEDVPCGSVKSSVLCNVKCKFIDAEDCILINVTAERIFARPGCIVYNVVDTGDDGLDLGEDQVMAGVFSSDGSQRIMNSSKAIDGGKAWSVEVAGNSKSFEAVYMANMQADPLTLERVIKESHEAKWHAIKAPLESGASSSDDANLSGVDKITNIPGNKQCVDCGAPSPDWASINLGVLMCLECSGIHRSLGTHISKVRSLELDVQCWQGDLLTFMCSVGNEAFNASWEACVPKGILRPNHEASASAVRKHFIMRKYQEKAFMRNAAQTEVSGVIRTQSVTKLGGKDKSMFHKWQPRTLSLSSDGKLFYSKSGSDVSSAQGVIDLKLPDQQVASFELGPKKSTKGFTFNVPTPAASEHSGRVFLFSCEKEIDCIDWIECINSAIPSYSPPPVPSVSESASSRVISHLEKTISSLVDKYESVDATSCLKRGPLSFKFDGKWSERLCTLTEDAVYISDMEHSKLQAIPRTVLYTDRNIWKEEGAPSFTFAFWCPLSYWKLAARSEEEKLEWIDAVGGK